MLEGPFLARIRKSIVSGLEASKFNDSAKTGKTFLDIIPKEELVVVWVEHFFVPVGNVQLT